MKKIAYLIKHPLFSGSAVMIFGLNLVNVLNYLYHLLMGRMLGPSGYGELVSLISVIGLFGIIPGSINLAVTKYVSYARSKDEVNKLISWMRIKIFQSSIIVFIIILVLTPGISSFLHISQSSYIILISISYIFSMPSGLNKAMLQGLLKFNETILSTLIESITKLLISIVVIYLGFYLFGVMAGLVISAAIGWYITYFYLKAHFINSPQKPPMIKDMILFAIPVMVQTVAATSLYTSDFILVKHFFSSSDSGIYAALSTLGKIIFFGAGPIGTVMFPIIAQRSAKGEDYNKIFKYSFIATLAVSLAAVFIYGFFPGFAIGLLYGSAYLGATGLLVWFGLFITLFTLATLLINFNLSLGRTKVVLFSLIASIFQILFIWFFHQNLYTVILISITVTALLLVSLLIYSIYAKESSDRSKIDLVNSSGL